MSVRSNMFPECYLECSLERALSCIDLAVGILSKYCNTGVGPNENLKKKWDLYVYWCIMAYRAQEGERTSQVEIWECVRSGMGAKPSSHSNPCQA